MDLMEQTLVLVNPPFVSIYLQNTHNVFDIISLSILERQILNRGVNFTNIIQNVCGILEIGS